MMLPQPTAFSALVLAYFKKCLLPGGKPARAPPAGELSDDVRRIVRELDNEGRWITTYAGEGLVGQPKFERGFRFISSDVFSRNVEMLSEHIASQRKE